MKELKKEHVLHLYKISTWYSPLNCELNNKFYELHDILFYNENGIVYRTGQGWFISENSSFSFDVKLLTSKPIKRKLKMDFSKNEPFIIKTDSSYSTDYDLYLPVSDFDIKEKYKKLGGIIFRYFSLVDDKGQELYGRENVKYLDGLVFEARINIQEIGNKFANYSYNPMSEKEFNDNINDLQKAYKKHIEILEYVKNYTVEDYLKELEENKEKEVK